MSQVARPAPFFIGEHPALDFLNSVAMPRTVLFDWLETGADLLDWMVAARLVSEAEAVPLRTSSELEHARQDIVAFREDFRSFIEEVCGKPLGSADHPIITRINTILARGQRVLQIKATPDLPADRPLALVDRHLLQTPQDLIVRIATAAARLIAEADFCHIRNCEGPTCTLYFLDVSKNHKRRWCSMEVCGNRAKAAAHRKR